jgi:hypothetical protein
MARARAQIGLQLIDGDKLIKQLEQLSHEVRNTVAKQAISAGLQPIQRAIEATAPESQGSREKQSKTTRQRWSGSKKLKTTIRSVIRERKRAGIMAGIVGLVGPSYSDGGGHGNLFSKEHKRRVDWGRDSGTIRKVNQFVKIAADETHAAAKSALFAEVKSGIDAAIRASRG